MALLEQGVQLGDLLHLLLEAVQAQSGFCARFGGFGCFVGIGHLVSVSCLFWIFFRFLTR